MGLPEKSDGPAGSGSGEPSMTTEKRRGLLLIVILWGYLRKATARQVVAQMRQVRRQKKGLFFVSSLFYGVN
jgi:hypothetical protein